MKKILSAAILLSLTTALAASAAVTQPAGVTQSTTNTQVYKNKYINVSVQHPTYSVDQKALPETETEKKINATKSSIDATKKNIKDMKSIWGIK